MLSVQHFTVPSALSQVAQTRSVRAPSRLPGWNVGHVLTDLARNADAHALRLVGALEGLDVPKYASGEGQRRDEISDGAGRPAVAIVGDLRASVRHLEKVSDSSSAARWPNAGFLGGGHYGVSGCPAQRLREVEMHHVDLGIGYTPLNWPQEDVDWDLPVLLATACERLGGPEERRHFMAVVGRPWALGCRHGSGPLVAASQRALAAVVPPMPA